MARKVLVSLGDEVKALLESHPDYRYGNCDDCYSRIFHEFVNSPQFKLDIANRTIERQERHLNSLKARGADLEPRLAEQTKKATEWMVRAIGLGWKPAPPSASPAPPGGSSTMMSPVMPITAADPKNTAA